jgi:ABC-2 type transport system ATP-binding protein/lipopolysaccharide transport system ATP-binding protein
MTPTPEPAIVADHVWKRFRLYRQRNLSLKQTLVRRERATFEEFWALRDVSLSIPRGETFGIIGHNGSGKSTMLRVIAGIHRPSKGSVVVHGRLAALLELGAGFHPDLSGRENIYLNGAIIGLSRREIREAYDRIVDFSGIGEFIDMPVRLYSSGMYVRLGFSIAVNLDPEVLLIDEILTVGDEEFQRRCMDHLYDMRRRKVTIVIVAHSLPAIQTLCDRAAWLDHGRLMGEGRANEMVDRYLEQVNQNEHDRLREEGIVEMAEDEDGSHRRGTREAEVTGVEYLDLNGERVFAARTGEPLIVRLRYIAHTPIQNPVFGLAFHHESGVLLAGPNTMFSGLETGMIDGEGAVEYRLDRLTLMPGSYLVSASISDEHLSHPFDFRDREWPLSIRPGNSSERYGMVELPGSFSLAPADSAAIEAGR